MFLHCRQFAEKKIHLFWSPSTTKGYILHFTLVHLCVIRDVTCTSAGSQSRWTASLIPECPWLKYSPHHCYQTSPIQNDPNICPYSWYSKRKKLRQQSQSLEITNNSQETAYVTLILHIPNIWYVVTQDFFTSTADISCTANIWLGFSVFFSLIS